MNIQTRILSELDFKHVELVFDASSPDFISSKSSHAGIIPDNPNESYSKETESGLKAVGIFVDEMPQTVITQVYNYKLDYVLLKGAESPVYIDNLRSSLDPDIRPGIGIIKVAKQGDAQQFVGSADVVLVEGE